MSTRQANYTGFNNQIPGSYDWWKIKLESTCFIYFWKNLESYWCQNKSKELRQWSTPFPVLYIWHTDQVWGSTYQYNIDTLEKLQKKAVRIICSANPYYHTGKLYDELKNLKIRYIDCYCVGQFVFTTNCYREYSMNTLYNMKYFTHMILEKPTCTDSRLLRKIVVEEVFRSVEWKCGNRY